VTSPAAAKIPILVVGGFLGSGKTTLLCRSLGREPGTAIIVNEFGEIGHDQTLLHACSERVSLICGGCACCVMREDLVLALRSLLDDHERGVAPLRRVVIEMSGLADPAPILFTIASDPVLRHHFEVRRVIVTVDAVNARAQLAAHPEPLKQVVAADVLVITKTDLADVQACDELRDALAAINPVARIRVARGGVLDGAVPLEGVDGALTRTRGKRQLGAAGRSDAGMGHAGDVHAIRLDAGAPLDWPPFVVWLSMLLHTWGEQVLRVKGVLSLDDGSRVAINGVQHIVHHPDHLTGGRSTDEPLHLIVIARGIDAKLLTASLRAFQRAGRTRRPPSRQEVLR
jgi:G3E family GTPase